MGKSYSRWRVSQIPFIKQPGQSEARHCTVRSRKEPPDSTKRWPPRKSLSCRFSPFSGDNVKVNIQGTSFHLPLETIWPERLEVLVVQLPSNITGCLSDQHIPARVPLNRCQGRVGGIRKKKKVKKHLLTAEEATRVFAVERQR